MNMCLACRKIFETVSPKTCPLCGASVPQANFSENTDTVINEYLPIIHEERKKHGLEELVYGLDCVVINTEPKRHRPAVEELLRYTGYALDGTFEESNFTTSVLKKNQSADILIRTRGDGINPFAPFNRFPKASNHPNTRLETFVFGTPDIEAFSAIQKARGICFTTDKPVRYPHFSFIQTPPSPFTGNALGFIQWHGERGNYSPSDAHLLDWHSEKPSVPHLKNIGMLDHAALRVKAENRASAVIELMLVTNYTFSFAIYVKSLNSITSVTRLSPEDFALVFTSGISSYVDEGPSGPTEQFIQNYGSRTHHLAFFTEKIEWTFGALKKDGLEFLSPLLGSPEDGLKQTFSTASEHTLLVTEYIHRYDGFDGFFTRSNVTELTRVTENQ